MATVETVLLSDNDRHRAYTGVDKFHKAGYYGQRVKACSGENWSLNYYNPGGLCVDPLGIGTGSGHAVDTAATFFQVAPKAKLYMLYSTNGRYGTTYDSKFFEYSADVIEKEGINNMFVSLLCSRHKQFFEDLGKWMDDHPFFKWFWAAGNADVDGNSLGWNLGYGFGDTSAATENLLIWNGTAHKLDDVTFHLPENGYMDTWRFTSSDGRFEMSFEPVLDRAACLDYKVIVSDQHQVFGKMSGTAILDDGKKIEIKDVMCFAEKVHNKY